MRRLNDWLPALAAALFVAGALLWLRRSPDDPALWCWLVGSLIYLYGALSRRG